MPDQELVKHVAQFDTIELGNMIVCGLPASPHDSVHESRKTTSAARASLMLLISV